MPSLTKQPPGSGSWAELTRALRYALHIDSLLAIASIALIVSLLEWLGTLPWSAPAVLFPLARVIPAAYFYLVLRKVATGALRLPMPRDYRDTYDTLLHPLLQAVVASFWFWGPLVVVAQLTMGLKEFLLRYECQTLSLFRQARLGVNLLLGWSLLQLPPALIATLVTSRVLVLLDASFGLRTVWRASGAYRRTFALLCLLTFIGFVADTTAVALERALPIPLATRVLRHLVVLWVPLAEAYLLGSFVRAHRQTLAAK